MLPLLHSFFVYFRIFFILAFVTLGFHDFWFGYIIILFMRTNVYSVLESKCLFCLWEQMFIRFMRTNGSSVYENRCLFCLWEQMFILFRHKLEWKLSTLKINLSDEKLQMLGDFCKHIPMPHSNSMMGLDDSVDGHIEPTIPIMVKTQIYYSYHD